MFAHGLWADGSCFSKLIPTLQAEGHEVMAAQHGLDSLASDVAAVKACLGRVSSPAILVGHSYGGTLITHAGTDRPRGRAGLHRRPRPGRRRDVAEPAGQVPDHRRLLAHRNRGRAHLAEPDGIGCFAGDLPEQEQKLVWATQGVPGADLFNQKVEGTAWRSKPSWYIVAKNDRTVHPELERFVAKRMGATTYEVDSSHVPMLSNPDLVLDVIRKAANAVQTATVSG